MASAHSSTIRWNFKTNYRLINYLVRIVINQIDFLNKKYLIILLCHYRYTSLKPARAKCQCCLDETNTFPSNISLSQPIETVISSQLLQNSPTVDGMDSLNLAALCNQLIKNDWCLIF